MGFDVITVGSATVDVFCETKIEYVKISTPDLKETLIAYPKGSKLLIKKLDFSIGGGGTNTAVSLARLGFKVAYLGQLGEDSNADYILSDLKKEGVNTKLIKKCSDRSGYSVILDSIRSDRTILAYKGANNHLEFSKINRSRLKTKWFYFSSMMKESFKTQVKLAEFAEKKNIKIMFNPSAYLVRKGVDHIKPILKRTEILILNNEEAEILVGEGEVDKLIEKLHSYGPKIVIITCGGKGAWTVHENELYHCKTQNIKIVETTGAGDAFASTFLGAYIRTKNIEKSMKLATVNAQSVIQHPGAKNNLLNWKKLCKEYKKARIKVLKRKL